MYLVQIACHDANRKRVLSQHTLNRPDLFHYCRVGYGFPVQRV